MNFHCTTGMETACAVETNCRVHFVRLFYACENGNRLILKILSHFTSDHRLLPSVGLHSARITTIGRSQFTIMSTRRCSPVAVLVDTIRYYTTEVQPLSRCGVWTHRNSKLWWWTTPRPKAHRLQPFIGYSWLGQKPRTCLIKIA